MKIIFVTVSLVLAAVAIKSAYGGFEASKTVVDVAGASMSPADAVSNLTDTIAGNV